MRQDEIEEAIRLYLTERGFKKEDLQCITFYDLETTTIGKIKAEILMYENQD